MLRLMRPIKEVIAVMSGYNGIINLEIEKHFDDQYEASLDLTRRYLSERDSP
jgi:hypothetical protein